METEVLSARERNGIPAGSQTLLRGLDVIEAISQRVQSLNELAANLGLTRSTTHRLATVLVERGYLKFSSREGYILGSKLLELGYTAQQALDVTRAAHDFLIQLSAATHDTTHLGVLDGTEVLYLDKIPGHRRVEVGSRIGERSPLTSTALGKSLLLGLSEEKWCQLFLTENQGRPEIGRALEQWLFKMRYYAASGFALDLEEDEDQIRCVSAPIRDATKRIIASISLSSAAQYMDDDRLAKLGPQVRETARSISRELGWTETSISPMTRKRERQR